MVKIEVVNPGQVAARLREGLLVIDVRLEDDFRAEHLPGAANNCVYEVAFGERLAGLAGNKHAPICVYGADRGSHEARMAAEKLRRAGYESVLELRDGLAGWKSAGYPVEGEGVAEKPQDFPDGTIAADLADSRVEWIGRNLLNHHRGRILLKSGELVFQGGQLTGGEFIVDMQSMSCDDLRGNTLHDVLIAHLASDDFFDVERYPEARFVIRRSKFSSGPPGTPNLEIQGMLTVKDVTRPLTFLAATGYTGDGCLAAQATLAWDRTNWNVLYGSGRFFRRLGGHLVNDAVEITLRVVTEKCGFR